MRRHWFIAALLAAAAVARTSDSRAGYTDSSFGCYRWSDGTGTCNGSMLAWRQASDSSAYAMFSTDSYNTPYFAAQTSSGGYVMCIPAPRLLPLWQAAIQSEGSFGVDWDASGTCTNLVLWRGSQVGAY